MFDYKNYGAFKRSAVPQNGNWVKHCARRIGLRNRYLKFLKGASRDAPLLEIGCGDGSFLRELLDAGFQRVHGIEPSPTYSPVVDAALISRAYGNEYLDLSPPNIFGTVIALDVFEHIQFSELRKLLLKIEERMMPGGVLMIRVPNLASGLGLFNYFGDASHTTALNEMSLRQLAFDISFASVRFHAEPFAYPRGFVAALGIVLWLPYRLLMTALLSAFGIKVNVLTPNIVCVMTKRKTQAQDFPSE